MGGGCGGLSRMMVRFQQDGGEVLVGWWWFYYDLFMIYVQVYVLCKFCLESILFFFIMFFILDEKNLLYVYICMFNL